MNTQAGTDDIFWLGKKEIARMWVTYLLTPAFLFFIGVAIASMIQHGALGPEANLDNWRDTVVADIVMLMMAALLATNLTIWGAYATWSDPVERKLIFFRSLPIPPRTIVGSRMITMLFALPFTVPAFFLPIYVLGQIELDLSAYIAFVLIWVGYALIWAGFNLYLELVFRSRNILWVHTLAALGIIAFAVLIASVFDVHLVAGVGRLASDYGVLLAPASLLAGVAVFLLAGRLVERILQRREMSE